MSFDGIERRNESRVPFYCPVEFVLRSEPGKLLKGAVRDISKSGLGMLSYGALIEGQEIILKSVLPGLHREYIVCWSDAIQEDLFAAGLRVKE